MINMVGKMIKEFLHDIWRFSKIRDWYWALEHRFNPGFRFHKIDTGLKPGYYDPDIRILYGVMEEVCSFFENTCNTIDWNATEEHQQTFMELLEIYEYWQWRKDFDAFDTDECDHLENDNPQHIMDYSKEYFNCLNKLSEKEEEVNELDQEMLHRVINIRFYLWNP